MIILKIFWHNFAWEESYLKNVRFFNYSSSWNMKYFIDLIFMNIILF